MRKLKEYALYYDDEFIKIGTIKELAKYMGLTEDSTRQLVSYCENCEQAIDWSGDLE